MDAGGLSRGGDVNGWDEHLVDDMDDAVRGLNVGQRDGGATNQHIAAARDAELDLVTVGGGGHHAVLDVARADFARHDVMEQNGGQRLVFLGRVKVVEIDAGVGEGLVGWGEDGERAGLLERGHQVSMGQGSDKRVVNARPGGVGGDILGGIGRCRERQRGGGQQGDDQEGQRLVHTNGKFAFEI